MLMKHRGFVPNIKECGGVRPLRSENSQMIACDYSPVYMAYGMVTIQPSTWP